MTRERAEERSNPTPDLAPGQETEVFLDFDRIISLCFPDVVFSKPSQLKPVLSFLSESISAPGVPLAIEGEFLGAVTDKEKASKYKGFRYLTPLIHNSDFRDISPATAEYFVIWKMMEGQPIKLRVPQPKDLETLENKLDMALSQRATPADKFWKRAKSRLIGPGLVKISENESGKVYKLTGMNEAPIGLHAIGHNNIFMSWDVRNPYLITEKGRNEDGAPFFRIALAVSTEHDTPNLHAFSPFRRIFGFEISPESYPQPGEPAGSLPLPTEKKAAALWIHGTDGPGVRVSLNTDEIREPLSIPAVTVEQLAEEKPFDLAKKAVEMLEEMMNQDSLSQDDVISPETVESVSAALSGLSAKSDDGDRNYLQAKIFSLALTGVKVGTDLANITAKLAFLADQNPFRFWRCFTSLGLHRLSPALSSLTDEHMESINTYLSQTSKWDSQIRETLQSAYPLRQGETLNTAEDLYDNSLHISTQPDILFKLYKNRKTRDLYHRILAEFQPGLSRIYDGLKSAGIGDMKISPFPSIIQSFSLFPQISQYMDHRPSKEFYQNYAAYMQACIDLAKSAENPLEPFACLVVGGDGQIIAQATNAVIDGHDMSHSIAQHAEIRALTQAAQTLEDEALTGCTVVSNVEPCAACAMEIRTRGGIKRVVYAVPSPCMGGQHRWDILSDPTLRDKIGKPMGEPPEITHLRNMEGQALEAFRQAGYKTMFEGL